MIKKSVKKQWKKSWNFRRFFLINPVGRVCLELFTFSCLEVCLELSKKVQKKWWFWGNPWHSVFKKTWKKVIKNDEKKCQKSSKHTLFFATFWPLFGPLFYHFLTHFWPPKNIKKWPLFHSKKWQKSDTFLTLPKVLRLRFFFYIFTFYKNIFSYAWKHLHAQNFYNHFITYLPPFFCFLSIYFYYFSSVLFFSLKSLFSFESCNYFFSQGGVMQKKNI